MNLFRCILGITAVVVLVSGTRTAGASPAVTDSVYRAHHPSILFTPDELPAIRTRLLDGGRDAEAYAVIYDLTHDDYTRLGNFSLLGTDFGMQAIPNVGLVAWIEEPFDTLAMDAGRNATIFLAQAYGPTNDEFSTGLRLRALVMGYDMFFYHATEAERETVLDEITDYIYHIIWSPSYDLFAWRPYLGNHSAMFAGPLGMAAVSLRGQLGDTLLDEAMTTADRVCERLIEYQFDPGGAYKEGAFYGLWTLKHLAFYFHARKRYDGFSYANEPAMRNMERWLAYELLPEGDGYSNNLNDSNYTTRPMSLNTAYFDWAIHEWNSGLSAWLWEHIAGEYGVYLSEYADNAATVLWHQPPAPVAPGAVLPRHALWRDRGLYYFRTGWPDDGPGDDVVFSFFSGKFHGGHAQEDQNQFTLYGYGEHFAVDHGSGGLGTESEAHNIVFVDGAGQHNAGAAIGTDGSIDDYLLSGFADYLVGDATAAYSTYSEFNRDDYPYPGISWSWGHKGANPVLSARRRVLVVHGPGEPYFLIVDDIEKDGQPHEYQWRMHTGDDNTVDTSADPITITGAAAALQIYALHPSFSALGANVADFNNLSPEPDSKLLTLATTAVDPGFAFLLLPVPTPASAPSVSRASYPWGEAVTIDRGGGHKDVLVYNPDGAVAGHGPLETDARVAALRVKGGSVLGFFCLDATALSYGGKDVVTCANGPLTCGLYEGNIDLSRVDADYRILDIGVTRVRYRDQELGFLTDGTHVVPDGVTAAGDTGRPRMALDLRAYPNPFNPSTTLRIHGTAPMASVDVYDVTGRRVRHLWQGRLDGTRELSWDGRNDDGVGVASGAYLVRFRAGAGVRSTKIILLK